MVATLVVAGCAMYEVPLPKGSCTTSTYGKSFARDKRSPDQYLLNVYVGGPPGSCREDALTVVHEEAPKFMTREQYQSYQIVSDRFNLVPSYFEFVVRFSRGTK
jgi:hypothetical protein